MSSSICSKSPSSPQSCRATPSRTKTCWLRAELSPSKARTCWTSYKKTSRRCVITECCNQSSRQSRSQLQSQSQATTALNIDLDARTNEITQIATSISELADLFRDLGNLVVEQGTVLDSVEYNVQQTARELVAAEGELKEAQRYQANTGRRKCILFLILIIVGLIIVLIYKPRGRETVVVPGNEDGGQAASAIEAIGSATATATDSSTSTSTRHRYRPKPSLGQYTTGEVITVSGGANPTISRGRQPLPKPPPLPTRPIDGEGAPF